MKKMTSLVATIATALLLSGLALIAPSPAQAASPTPGSDCGCPTTGPYVSPQAPVDPEIEPDGSSAPSNPKYRVEASGAWPDVTVQVRRLADAKVVLTVNGAPANWGFSPDQDRFVTHGVVNGTFYVQLYDLTAANPGTAMWGTSTLSSENRVAFSPHGRYLAFTWQNNVSTDTVQHQFVDTATGREFDVSYSYYIPAAGKKFGEVGFGFSPDANDRAFFTSYVTSQTDVQNALYDLRGRTTTWSHLRVGTGFWKFSPCGDVLGVVEQDGQIADNVALIRVSDGQQIAAQSYPISYIALRTTSASHIVSVDNVDHVLAPNAAGATCADTQAPTWPTGATLATSNVAKTSLTLTWPAATDDKAVTQYKVYKGSTLLATLGSTARTYNVTGLTQGTSYTFTVQAADAAGNGSTDGPSVTVRTAADAPTWPAGSTVVAGDLTEAGATLRWSAASGSVTSYKVYRDGTLLDTVPGTARSYAATNLAPGTAYVFKIEAVGSTGAESATGPSVRVRTPGYQQLDANEITGTIWWDDNSDQVRDATESGVDPRVDPDLGVYAYRIVDGTVVETARGAAVHADGTFTIDNVTDGDYIVSAIVGDSRKQTFPGDYQPHRVTVSGGHGVGAVDFGLKLGTRPTQGTGSGTISAALVPDGGGSLDGAGVSCYFTSLGSGCGTDPTAGADGTFSISGLTAGTYEIGTVLQAHQWQTAPVDADGHPLRRVVVIGSNGGSGSADFTVLQGRSTITGEVYDDVNGNGAQDSGEGALTAPDTVDVCVERVGSLDSDCTTTDGSYSFSDLRPGDYELRVDQYGGWGQTEPAGDPVRVHVETNGTTVQAGLLGAHNPRGVIEGVVWDDKDADGKHDAGEPGLPDVVVCDQIAGEEGWNCLNTDADGRYRTGLVPAGEHAVWIPTYTTDRTQTFPADGQGYNVIVVNGEHTGGDFGLNDGTVVPEITAPDAPTDVVATPAVESVTLTWSAPANDGGAPVTGYVVERETPDGWVEVGTPTDATLEVTGLTGGEPASFRVAAVNSVGTGAWSDVVGATPQPRVVVPGAPEAVTATAGIEKVALAWSAPAEDGGAAVTGYVVQQETTDGWVEVGTPADTALEVTGLTAGTPASFRVAAVNEVGQGAWSDVVTATPQPKPVATAPSAPSGLTATVSSNRRTIKLAWNAPANDGGAPVTDYVVQASWFPLFGWYVVNDGVSATPTATITSPLPGLKRYYRVAARNSVGLGAWSTPVRAG